MHPEAMQTDAKGINTFMNANSFHPAGANWINPSHPLIHDVTETADLDQHAFHYPIAPDRQPSGHFLGCPACGGFSEGPTGAEMKRMDPTSTTITN